MKKFLYYFKQFSLFLQFILLLADIILTVSGYQVNFFYKNVRIIMVLSLISIEIIRLKYQSKKVKTIQSSELTAVPQSSFKNALGISMIDNKGWLILVSMLLCLLIMLMNGEGFIQIYYFFLLDYIYNIENLKLKQLLILQHFAGILGTEAIHIFLVKHHSFNQGIWDLLIILIYYSMILVIFSIIHYFKTEQIRLQRLNSDLITYSFEERDYLIEKERSEISQELHDSIGHSLMAALLNVRYLKAISQNSQEEKDAQMNEIENLLKECVISLRNSVSDLRELDYNVNLKEDIQRIIQKFNLLGFVKIELEYDDTINKASKQIKSAIYRTIKEGITNSIRHGKASKISISILVSNYKIKLIIHDNGIGCMDINKSYGLNGILERFKTLNGSVDFESAKNKGFTIRAVVTGRFENDSDYDS